MTRDIRQAGRLALDAPQECLRDALSEYATLMEALRRAAVMGLPGWYLVAGAV